MILNAMEQGVRSARIIETENDTWLMEVTFNKDHVPYYLATARDPYIPRELAHVQTAIQKAREILAIDELTVIYYK